MTIPQLRYDGGFRCQQSILLVRHKELQSAYHNTAPRYKRKITRARIVCRGVASDVKQPTQDPEDKDVPSVSCTQRLNIKRSLSVSNCRCLLRVWVLKIQSQTLQRDNQWQAIERAYPTCPAHIRFNSPPSTQCIGGRSPSTTWRLRSLAARASHRRRKESKDNWTGDGASVSERAKKNSVEEREGWGFECRDITPVETTTPSLIVNSRLVLTTDRNVRGQANNRQTEEFRQRLLQEQSTTLIKLNQ